MRRQKPTSVPSKIIRPTPLDVDLNVQKFRLSDESAAIDFQKSSTSQIEEVSHDYHNVIIVKISALTSF